MKIYQRGVFVGTVDEFPRRSNSAIFEIRPGDFKGVVIDGEAAIEASPMIGPGDFACLPTFRRPDGTPEGPGEAAMMFDRLVESSGRLGAMQEVIRHALEGKPS